MENFGKFMFAVFTVTIGMIINSFVIYKLWLWIAVPVFKISPITLGSAFGISVIVSFLTQRTDTKKDENLNNTDKITKLLITNIVIAIVYLFVGWIASMVI